jgi:putative MATE family efflux protein
MKSSQIRKEILVIAFPVMLQMIAEYILRFTDMAFIGNYVTEGLSALNNVLMPYFLFLSFLFALSKGVTILIAQGIGAGCNRRSVRYAENAMLFNTVISLAYFLFWFFFATFVLKTVGARGTILEMGVSYLAVSKYQFLFFGVVLTARSIFEGTGKTYPILAATIVSVAVNIFLDWMMIFGNLGFPEMGIKGAALATVSAQVSGAAVLLGFLASGRFLPVRLLAILRPRFKIYWKSFKLGFPSGLEFMIWTLGQVLIIRMLNSFDPMAAGVYGVFSLLLGLSLYIYIGIGIASLNLVGKATGAGNWNAGLRAGNMTMRFALYICLVSALLFVLFPGRILQVFTSDSSFISSYSYLLYICALIIFPRAINVVGGNAIRGTGNTRWMLFTQIPGTVIIVFLVWLFLFILKTGIVGLFWALLIDESWRALVNYLKFIFSIKSRARLVEVNSAT